MKVRDFNSGTMDHLEKRPILQKWVQTVIWGWVTLLVSADLKVTVHPYIHWFVSGAALFLVLPILLRRTYRVSRWGAISACILIFAVVLSSFQSPNPLFGLEQMAKLIILLLVTPVLFNSIGGLAEYGFRAFVSSVYINLAFLFLGKTFLPSLAGNLAVGRWGTVLNYPGSLWKVGIAVIVYATYCFFASRFRSLSHLVLLLAGLVLVYFDGSRTAILLLAVSFIYLVVITWVDGRRRIAVTLVGAFLVVAAGLSMTGISAGDSTPADSNVAGLQRFAAFAQNAWQGSNALVGVDESRVNMMHDALDAIQNHPFIGTGIGTTKSETEVGPMVVHNAYLQVWADLGLLGFIGFVGLVLGWVALLPRVLPKIRRLPELYERGLYYNAIFLLIYFAVSGLFHPLSTEWSEWITFIVPYTLLLGIARSEPLEVNRG